MKETAGAAVIEVVDGFCLLATEQGAVAALRGINLVVPPGERLVVHGPNGSGKTTLLRVLVGDQALAAGTATVAGRRVGHQNAELSAWRAERLGWIDQHPARTLRPELDVLDNVALQLRLLGRRSVDARLAAAEALDLFGVAELADRTIDALSGGEAQRVAAAAAIVHRPSVVFADEPAGQLDADNADNLYRALADVVGQVGAALVLVSHDERAGAVADRVVRIRDGRVAEVRWPGRASPLRHQADASTGEAAMAVDRRGWMRLPDAARSAAGITDAAVVRVESGVVTVRPVSNGAPAPRAASGVPASPVPSGAPGSPVAPDSPGALVPPGLPVVPGVPASPGEPGEPGGSPLDGAAERRVVASMVGVGSSFDGRVVLGDIDLAVRAGTITVVQGPSGSGKSTLLRILAGLQRPTAGTVMIGGEPLAGLGREGLADLRRRHAAIVLQEIHLAETATLATNLELARSTRGLARDRPNDQALLDRLGIGHLAERPANGCSGGERQRAALARALVTGAALLILDEPSSQLDEASTELVAEVVREAARTGAAIVVATHDPGLVAVADTVHRLG